MLGNKMGDLQSLKTKLVEIHFLHGEHESSGQGSV